MLIQFFHMLYDCMCTNPHSKSSFPPTQRPTKSKPSKAFLYVIDRPPDMREAAPVPSVKPSNFFPVSRSLTCFAAFLAFLLLLLQLGKACSCNLHVSNNSSDQLGIRTCFHQFLLSACCFRHVAKQIHGSFCSYEKRKKRKSQISKKIWQMNPFYWQVSPKSIQTC